MTPADRTGRQPPGPERGNNSITGDLPRVNCRHTAAAPAMGTARGTCAVPFSRFASRPPLLAVRRGSTRHPVCSVRLSFVNRAALPSSADRKIRFRACRLTGRRRRLRVRAVTALAGACFDCAGIPLASWSHPTGFQTTARKCSWCSSSHLFRAETAWHRRCERAIFFR